MDPVEVINGDGDTVGWGWGEAGECDGAQGQGQQHGLGFSGGIAAEEKEVIPSSSLFQNIPCLACGSNCIIKRERETTSEGELSSRATAILTGTEFLKIFCQILKIKGGSAGSKVNYWEDESEGGEGVPICNDCKSQLSLLAELERKLRELGAAFEKGVGEFRKLCEGAEGVFEREGIYDKDKRYFKMRKQFVRVPVKRGRPRRTDLTRVKISDVDDPVRERRFLRGSTRTKGVAALSSYSPVVAVSAEDKEKADQVLKTEKGDSDNDIYDDNFDGGAGPLEHNYLGDAASVSNNDDDNDNWRPSETSRSKSTKRKLKSKASSRSALINKRNERTSKVEIGISHTPSTPTASRSRRKRKLPRLEVATDDIPVADSDSEYSDFDEGPKAEKDSDFELSDKAEQEAVEEDDLLDEDTLDRRKERTRHDPATGLYSVLHVKFRPLLEDSNKLQCLECQTICSKSMIRVHTFKCHTSMFKCKIEDCEKSFGNRRGLRNHILIDHKKTKKKYRKAVKECDICGRPCMDMFTYHKHITTHYSEQDKAEAIARGEELQTWKDRAILQCDHCGGKYSSKVQLERHVLAKHAKEESESDQLRKFKELCPECGTLIDKVYLAKHRLTVHHIGADGQPQDPETQKRFICSYCDKRFFLSRQLLHHKRSVHERIFPFKCTLCPRSFSERRQLTRHTDTVHNNIRPHPCLHCPVAFFNAAHLRRHVKTYHTEGARPGRKAYVRGALKKNSVLKE